MFSPTSSTPYDALGQLKNKNLGNGLETQAYDYNTRWPNYPTMFPRDVVTQDDDVDTPSIWKNSPSNIVDEFIEEGNSEVKYDPKTGTTTVGEGDESDTKKSGGKRSTTSTIPNSNGTGWAKLGALLNNWLKINPNIQVTIQ